MKAVIPVVLFAVATSLSQSADAKKIQPFSINQYEKRLNTANCQDKDDWYLDGFKIAQDYPEYADKLLSQREDYCRYVTESLRQAWYNGFNAANGEIAAEDRGNIVDEDKADDTNEILDNVTDSAEQMIDNLGTLSQDLGEFIRQLDIDSL
ncbi:Uncharacterised protein [Haemophilus pittmaniae]|uniref:Uncharacterized protein n=1 Tax=Haemophilus pittmaniae TaxID=249188 RepID=A0A377IWE0_9PAST|nr:hypothetical protein [Haemophilus pittmaniae]MBS6026883.1 hypothetical protein [Haemophilus pittmaniae]STO92545.1 Uncharacterised protein [Haemophilus pittmaniae]